MKRTSLPLQRREFITLLGGAAACPLTARAQQVPMRRVGVMVSGLPPDDPESQTRLTAFVQGLQRLGWTGGRNVQIDIRFGLGDPERIRKYAAELVALGSEVILVAGPIAVPAVQQASGTVGIVFANVNDPVGLGYVASLARPGGNLTGFMSVEFDFAGKWLELLKQIAPAVTRVAVVRDVSARGIGMFAAARAAASSLRVELTPIDVSNAHGGEIENRMGAFAQGRNEGLIVAIGGLGPEQRASIIALAARHHWPAVYPFRGYVTEGGLASYGNDQAEPYRLASGYVDRILRGEKPADLPVQAPTKYELVINLKTAKSLGLTMPQTLLATADELIQ